MLGTIIEKLQTLLSKSFLISAFFPVLIAAALNAVLLYTQSSAFQAAVARYGRDDTGLLDTATTTMAVLITLAILALLLSMLNTRLREVLEGRVFWPAAMAAPLIRRQTDRHDRLERQFKDAQKTRSNIARQHDDWQRQLQEARSTTKAPGTRCQYPDTNSTAAALRELRARRERGEPISKPELDTIVRELRQLLSTQAVDAPPDDDRADAKRLDDDQGTVLLLAEYAVSLFSNEEYRLSGELQFGFAGRSIAPTAMGNVAQSIPHYAFTRYGMNIDLFWTRLQKTMQSDNFYVVLQDAKTQLDFLVALVWLVGATLVVWLPLMALRSHDVRPFLVTAVAGPVALSGLYQLAVQNYRAFADLTDRKSVV